MPNFCGGLKYDHDTLKVENGIVTIFDNDESLTNIVTPCGQFFDGNIFEVVKVDGSKVLTATGIDTDIPMLSIIKSSCGLKLDARFFSLKENKELIYHERHILEVLVNPPTAQYIIIVTQNEEPIESFEGTDNIFPMDEIDAQYSISVTADNYQEFTQQVTADADHIVTAVLTPVQSE